MRIKVYNEPTELLNLSQKQLSGPLVLTQEHPHGVNTKRAYFVVLKLSRREHSVEQLLLQIESE